MEDQDFQKLSLKFFNGNSIPTEGERDATNYYEWKYDENIQALWKDEMGYEGRSYLNNESCQKSNDVYSFCIGIKDTFPEITYYHENWRTFKPKINVKDWRYLFDTIKNEITKYFYSWFSLLR